jgi:hypothetical protein
MEIEDSRWSDSGPGRAREVKRAPVEPTGGMAAMGRFRTRLLLGVSAGVCAGIAILSMAIPGWVSSAQSEPVQVKNAGEVWLVTTTGAKKAQDKAKAETVTKQSTTVQPSAPTTPKQTEKKSPTQQAPSNKTAEPAPASAKSPAVESAGHSAAPNQSKAQFPTTLDEVKNRAAALNKPDIWPEADVAAARARCTQILQGVQAVTMPEEPVKEGACGTPAPVRLISVGKNPEVALSPPPLVNCDMVAAIADWVKDDLQPLAKKHLSAEVLTIEVMSDYSCRAAYGRKGRGWSEHAFANALDIRGFFTNKAQSAYVLEDWGKPEREIRYEIAAAKAKAEKAAKEKAAAEAAIAATQKSPDKNQTAANSASSANAHAAPAAPDVKSTLVEGISNFAKSLPPGGLGGSEEKAAFDTAPDKLGGPKYDVNIQLNAGGALPAKAIFLRATHTAACKRFGTTLGPESNAAHRNHLHIDLAERKSKKYCE